MTMELICPAGTPAALRAAVEAGAHAVYCGFADETNARNFPGLNFDRSEMREGIAFAHAHELTFEERHGREGPAGAGLVLVLYG